MISFIIISFYQNKMSAVEATFKQLIGYTDELAIYDLRSEYKATYDEII